MTNEIQKYLLLFKSKQRINILERAMASALRMKRVTDSHIEADAERGKRG